MSAGQSPSLPPWLGLALLMGTGLVVAGLAVGIWRRRGSHAERDGVGMLGKARAVVVRIGGELKRPRSIRAYLVPVLLVVVPTSIAYAWGLSWAAGDFPECSSGSYVFADLMWGLGGFLLGLVVGITVPIVLAARRTFLLAIPVLVAGGIGMYLAGDAGATIAPSLVGCSEWDTREAELLIAIGLAIGGVPTVVVTAIALGIGWLSRPRPSSSRDDTRPPTDPAT